MIIFLLPKLDVNYFLLTYIPVVLFGGWSCILITVFSYMSNNTTKKERFFKFALYELFSFSGWSIELIKQNIFNFQFNGQEDP